jgi:ABC-type sulfate transport system substrate-binding protein
MSSKYKSACALLILATVPVQSGQWEDFARTDITVLASGHVHSGGPGKDRRLTLFAEKSCH